MNPDNPSTPPTDQEVDDFFDALTGRQEKHRLGKALRQALEHDQHIITEAETATLCDLNEQEAIRMEFLRQSLVSQGILSAESVSPSPLTTAATPLNKGPKP